MCGGGGYHCEADQCVCTPDCAGKECGPDGCGGQCGLGPDGACPEGALCMPDAQCCLPDCAGKECGPDDCGGSCGSCPGANGKCDLGVCACEPDCQGKECGPDGCGGQCGECGADAYCEEGICQMEVGGFLYPCTQNADCLSGFCVETPAGETVCTVQCLEDCPGGWTCKLLPDSCPDCQFVCLPV